MSAIETTPNIGKVLGGRLRHVGIETREALEQVGDVEAFAKLVRSYPEDACTHTRLALAGAVRGIRWHDLDAKLRKQLTVGLSR
jgi:DNA transformation protein and related proteins